MKAIILSHENGGSYCIDSTGSFHFVKGYENMEIGTEICIKVKKPVLIRRFLIACFCIIIAFAIVGFTCTRVRGVFGGEAGGSGEVAVYAGFCMD